MGYQLSRDAAAEPLLICGMVGLAEQGLTNAAAIELMAAKNSPNLYWALADLPRPLVDLRRAARAELSWEFNLFPFMRDAENTEHSPQEWARLLGEAFSQAIEFTAGDSSPMWKGFGGQAGAAGFAMLSYSAAKQRLIDAGFDAQRVEKMPVGQVVTIDGNREYRVLADNALKNMYVPYSVLRSGGHGIEAFQLQAPKGLAQVSRGYGYVLASMLLPALDSVRTAGVRMEWQLNAMMVVEAIRMHAAKTGKLPAKLDEITVAPVPENPATGQPYEYRLDGDTAVLDLPPSDGFPGVAWRFEIKLAK